MHWFGELLEAGRQMTPHGYCLLWRPELVWLHVLSDVVIAIAYFSIPMALLYFVRKRRDVEFGWVIWLFAAFIVACGATHLMSIWTLWHADYFAEGLIKAATAVASIGTAIALWPVIPQLLAIPSPSQVANDRDRLASALDSLTRATAERNKAEDALRQAHKMEAVGRLTGGIAHDFNNLLQTITGAVDMIGRQPDGPKVGKWASLARQAADRGAKLTSQLLAFSRTQKLQLRPITIAPLIEGLRELMQTSVGPTIKVEYALAGPNLVHVCGDPTQIELALINLAVNARDSMPDGGTLRISTQHLSIDQDPELENGRYLELSVEDEGRGMSHEVQRRAFEPFYTTKGVKGSGLGLAMVYGVAKQSGGRAIIESTPGKGTRVSMLFRVVDETAGELDEHQVGAAGAQRGSLVLLVDDDDVVRTVTAGLLDELGHSVVEANGGEGALEVLKTLTPNLLVLDYAMPGMTGAELAAKVRANGIHVPIIYATGYSDTAAIAADGVVQPIILAKPFTTSELEVAIAQALAGADAIGGSLPPVSTR